MAEDEHTSNNQEQPVDVGTDRGRDADNPAEVPAKGWKDVLVRVKDEMKVDHVPLSAAAVAFHAFLALVPLLIAAVSIYGLFADPSNITTLVDRLGPSVPEQLKALIEEQLTSIVNASGGALRVGAIIGILAAIWSASSGMSNLMEAINIAYDEDPDDRPFWKKRGVAILLTLLTIAFLAVVATIIGFAGAQSGAVGIVLFVVAAIVAAVLLMGVLAVIYRYATDRDNPEWAWVSTGSVVAVVGWLIASAAFTFYVSNFGSYNETYGSLGAIIVVLLWLLISALMILIGAEINAEMEHQTTEDTTVGDDQPLGARDAHVADDVGRATS